MLYQIYSTLVWYMSFSQFYGLQEFVGFIMHGYDMVQIDGVKRPPIIDRYISFAMHLYPLNL